MRKLMGVAAAMSLLGAPAWAQTPETTSDVRCVATLSIIAAQNKNYESEAALGVM